MQSGQKQKPGPGFCSSQTRKTPLDLISAVQHMPKLPIILALIGYGRVVMAQRLLPSKPSQATVNYAGSDITHQNVCQPRQGKVCPHADEKHL